MKSMCKNIPIVIQTMTSRKRPGRSLQNDPAGPAREAVFGDSRGALTQIMSFLGIDDMLGLAKVSTSLRERKEQLRADVGPVWGDFEELTWTGSWHQIQWFVRNRNPQPRERAVLWARAIWRWQELGEDMQTIHSFLWSDTFTQDGSFTRLLVDTLTERSFMYHGMPNDELEARLDTLRFLFLSKPFWPTIQRPDGSMVLPLGIRRRFRRLLESVIRYLIRNGHSRMLHRLWDDLSDEWDLRSIITTSYRLYPPYRPLYVMSVTTLRELGNADRWNMGREHLPTDFLSVSAENGQVDVLAELRKTPWNYGPADARTQGLLTRALSESHGRKVLLELLDNWNFNKQDVVDAVQHPEFEYENVDVDTFRFLRTEVGLRLDDLPDDWDYDILSAKAREEIERNWVVSWNQIHLREFRFGNGRLRRR